MRWPWLRAGGKAGPITTGRTIQEVGIPASLERGIWATAFGAVRRNLAVCLLVAVLLTAAHLVQYWGHGGGVLPPLRAVLLIFAGYVCHRTLVTGGETWGFAAATGPGFRRAARFAGVQLMILVPILVLGLCLTIPEVRAVLPGVSFLPFMVAMIVLYGIGLVLLGTALPEIAATGEVDFGRAVASGRRDYRAIARGMVWGPWIFGAGHTLVMLGAEKMGLPKIVSEPDAGAILVWLAARLAESGGHVLAEALRAAVLVAAWHRARPVPNP